MIRRRAFLIRLLVLLIVGYRLIHAPTSALAQEPPNSVRIYDENEVAHDLRALRALQANSRFRLFGELDRAVTSLRSKGKTAYGRGMEYFTTNTGIIDAADLNMDTQPDIAVRGGARAGQYFDVSPIYAAGRDEWARFVALVPSLANATGGGYAVSRNFPTLGRRELFAADGEFGTAFSGVQSTADGSCRDLTSDETSNIAPGLTLLAASDCPSTWPLVNGVPKFRGRRPISQDAWGAAQAALGPEFNFDWWRVDPALIDPTRFLGNNVHTYGAYDDFNSAMIGRFGDVVPGGFGKPLEEGWPLGLRTEFDAFTFTMPTVANSMFWRATIINETEKVYGVPLDYEKLYIGYTQEVLKLGGDETAFYHEVWRGTTITVNSNTGEPPCPGVAPPGVAGIDCEDDNGFAGGVTAHVVLKSPIGDLRNVLLSCDPAENPARAANRAIPCTTDRFNDPGNPHAGDTITFNHHRMCPYGETCGDQTLLGPDRQMFGAVASNVDDVLNGRDLDALGPAPQYSMFRNPNFPQTPAPFSYWVPGSWDYTANGETPGGDTIWVPSCYGPPGVVIHGTTREKRSDACTVTWSDTMPVGELGNPAYNNQEGNVSYWSVGPFALAAGDTTALVIALVTEADSAAFEEELNNVIQLYMDFYLTAQPPPKVSITGIDIASGATRDRASDRVTLYWDDASDDYVDPYLEGFADHLSAPTTGWLARLKALNPDLEARIRDRARDNLARILIYKSCDGGTSFTAADTDDQGRLDCDGEPTRDTEGRPLDTGWEAYAVLPVDRAGEAPNSFVDDLVLPGQSYLYVVIGQSRGATFLVTDSLDSDGDGRFDTTGPDSLSLAPPMLNPLFTSPAEPNVVSVYVPASIQAGGQDAEATIEEPDTFGLASGPFEIQFTGTPVADGRYRVAFANWFEIEEVRGSGGALITTSVKARDVVRVETGPDASADSAIDTKLLVTQNPNGVDVAGEANVTVSGDTTLITLERLGFLLFRIAADDSEEPLLVSQRLDGRSTTPLSFIERRPAGGFTGYPGFILFVDDTNRGALERQSYEITLGGDTIPEEQRPSVIWRRESERRQWVDRWVPRPEAISSYGRYDITWVDFTFGPAVTFELDFDDPAATQEAFSASLLARQAGTLGRTDAAAAEAIGVTEGDLVPVRAPFTVRNAPFGREVDIAMGARRNNQVLLGNLDASDTLTLEVPETTWIPGDELYFLETVELDSTGTSGGVVLDGSGRPIKTHRLVATFAPALLSCPASARDRCNPVDGTGSTDDWVTNRPGQNLAVFYNVPYQLDSRLTFAVRGPVTGHDVIAARADISAQMDSIHAVPNPFILHSAYQTSGIERRLMFTHLPPEGVLRIFTVSGAFVQEIPWGPSDLAGNGDLFWDLRTREGYEVGSGLYVFVVEAVNPATFGKVKKIGKFVVIH